MSPASNWVDPYLQNALFVHNLTKPPVNLFGSSESTANILTWPQLIPDGENQILLYPGSYNPPHQGHLATIRYFYERRKSLRVVALFVYADPSLVIATKEKKYGTFILPRTLRNQMFLAVPELSTLVSEHWLYFLGGDMESHIQVLRSMTDMMTKDSHDVKLTGFLGGDKLSIESEPHGPPGDLDSWGPVDQFLIMNARRPVDFYDPGVDERPRDLPGCTGWSRGSGIDEGKESVGELWTCNALTVKATPVIQFRASGSSASNGISSTKIRRIMTEAVDGDLFELLKDLVVSTELLVEWLVEERKRKRIKE